MDFKKFYEWYHRDRKLPKRVITSKNFTYRIMLNILDRYCKSRDVLDIGSGVGTVDFYLAKKGKDVTGIEISERAFKIAEKSSKIFRLQKKVHFRRIDIFKTNIDKRYNFVVCSEVMEHLADDKKAIKIISKIVKKEGLLMLTVPSINAPLTKVGAIDAFDKRSGHLRRYSLESGKKLLKDAGFKTIFSRKNEGIVRNSLFVFRWNFVIKLANRFAIISDLLTLFDDISLKLFGESDLIFIARRV
jgi:SAM-dependent methyltransferase